MGQDNESTPVEAVNHPKHYNFGTIEVIDVIEAWKMPFHLGNTIKYIARSGKKGDMLEDLKKAEWYLSRYINYKHKNIIDCAFWAELTPDMILEDWKLDPKLNVILKAIFGHYYTTALKLLVDYIVELSNQNSQ